MRFVIALLAAALSGAAQKVAAPLERASLKADLAVYGSTPSGIAAAVVAARQGHSVLLLEPSGHVGGLLTGGLSYTDFRTRESVTGFFREYMQRVVKHYADKYGADSRQVRECFEGAHAEPHVSAIVLGEMIRETGKIRLLTRHRAVTVATAPAAGGLRRIHSIALESPNGRAQAQAKFFVDATYEGDLAAIAGVPYRVGRESSREYGERMAGRLYFRDGRTLMGSTGEADQAVQCYNFRVVMTDRPELMADPPRPAEYRREEFLGLIPHFRSGKITNVYTEDHSGILRLQRIANGKADMNDIKNAPVRLALPGESDGWPDGSPAKREDIWRRHKDYTLGLLWFLRNDEEVPETIRKKARAWGLARDEWPEHDHFPPALYVREARRIEGEFVFTEHDTQPQAGGVRARHHRDSIAIGDYVLNSHGHRGAGPPYPDLVEGDFAFPTVPFQIPYGTIVPKKVDNLLVTVAVSASHVGFSALRLEPTWTALGHAAGLAASLAIQRSSGARGVPVRQLQERLIEQGQAIIYISDVLPGMEGFAAAQRLGGIHGWLHDVRAPRLASLEFWYGLQYSRAFADHRLEPAMAGDDALRKLWQSRLRGVRLPVEGTRGSWLRAADEVMRLEGGRVANAAPLPRSAQVQ